MVIYQIMTLSYLSSAFGTENTNGESVIQKTRDSLAQFVKLLEMPKKEEKG